MAQQSLGDLAKNFAELRKRLAIHLPVAMKMAGQLGANYAIEHHDYNDQSGALTASIGPGDVTGSFVGNDLQTTVGAGAGYARWVEGGTVAHDIRPRFKKMLRFPVEGGFAFRSKVRHPGTRARYFINGGVSHAIVQLREKLVPDVVELAMHESGLVR